MTKLTVTEAPKGHFSLQGELNRHTIPESESLIAIQGKVSAKNSEKSILDMAGVSHADTAGLAWLMNLLKDSREKNIEVELKNIPETLINLAKISDVDGFLSVQ